jgi:hypothetical protein
MTGPTLTTTLDAWYAGVLGTCQDTFGARVQTYAPFDPATMLDPAAVLNTPALCLQVEAMEADEDTARKGVRDRAATRIAAAVHVILSTRTDNLQVALDVLASAVHVLIRQPDADSRLGAHPGARWGLGPAATPAERVSAQPADWQPGLNGYDSRVIRFEQIVYLPDDPLACLAEPAPETDPDADPEPDPEPDPDPAPPGDE